MVGTASLIGRHSTFAEISTMTRARSWACPGAGSTPASNIRHPSRNTDVRLPISQSPGGRREPLAMPMRTVRTHRVTDAGEKDPDARGGCTYYMRSRRHLGLDKDSPAPLPVMSPCGGPSRRRSGGQRFAPLLRSRGCIISPLPRCRHHRSGKDPRAGNLRLGGRARSAPNISRQISFPFSIRATSASILIRTKTCQQEGRSDPHADARILRQIAFLLGTGSKR